MSLNPERNYLLLGPRRVGKSTFLKQQVRATHTIDLLLSDVFYEYRSRPALLRERFGSHTGTIVIDEIQLLPELVREVHWLIENTALKFVLSGSSARKLRQQGVTNLAGRLRTQRMVPLTYFECPPETDFLRLLQYGSLPPLLNSTEPDRDLRDYCGEYLKEEIQSEGIVRNIPGFTRFLEAAAFSNAELVSYENIARECGVSAKTVAQYYSILEDTLLGYFLAPYEKSKKRRAVKARKFYMFDCSVANSLLGRKISEKTPEFGKSFEQFLVTETYAAMFYENTFSELRHWRSSTGFEVDLLIEDHTAVEFKSGAVHPSDCSGLLAFSEELTLKNRWIVCREKLPRQLSNGIEVIPWQEYLERLRLGVF